MKNIITGKIIFGLLSIFVVLACGLIPSGQAEIPADATEPAVSSDVSGECNHPYFPAVLNTIRTYKSSGTSKGEFTVTETVSAVRADGFTVLSDYGSSVKSVEWSCTPEGLGVFNTANDRAEGLSVDSAQFQLNVITKNPTGVTLPAKVEAGNKWTQAFEFETTGKIGGNTTTSTGTSTTTYEALGVEGITTPAGTFQAMKITSQIKEDIQGMFNGTAANSSNEYQILFWFVEGVGLVRSETTGSYTETMELQSYSIP